MQTNHRAKKSLGQNFLQDANIARKIVDSLRITSDDNVIEIGPGQGALTGYILEAGPASLTLIEKDRDLAPALEDKFPEVEVMQQDALRFKWEELDPDKKWKIVGNLPYNVASKIMWDVAFKCRAECVFMVQHEVGIRITADPGSKKYGAISVWVQSFCHTEYLFKVPPTVFRPQPKVDSAVIKFFPRAENEKPVDIEGLASMVKYCFQYRRKQLGKILKSFISECVHEWAEKEGVSLTDRPEALSPLQFQGLHKCLKNDFPS